MNSQTRQYAFGIIFMGVGFYQLSIKDYLEFSLYTVAGVAFVVNALSLEPRLLAHKKILGILSWILIIATGLLFLYLIQFKF